MLLTQLAGGRRENFTIMESTISSSVMEEFELMKQAKYRVYLQNIDKSLKNFEYSSEWADLISALGKLNKVSQTFKVFVVMMQHCRSHVNIQCIFSSLLSRQVISSYPQFQVIPRRIKISKRLAQCMHPCLPSGECVVWEKMSLVDQYCTLD